MRNSPAARNSATHASFVVAAVRSRRSRSACRTSRTTTTAWGIAAPMMPAPAVITATQSGTSAMQGIIAAKYHSTARI
jgi:hypothetical protein